MEAQKRRLSILCSHIRPIGQEPGSVLASSFRTSDESTAAKCLSMLPASDCDSCPPNPEKLSSDSSESDCVFCKIIRGKAPALKLYEDNLCLCILDTNPVSPGHCLIIPRSHFPSLVATPSSRFFNSVNICEFQIPQWHQGNTQVVAAMCSKVPYISKAVMKATGCDSFNLLVNNGVAAGQVIFHTHIHIIPRKARDCLWASESLKRHPLKVDQEALHLVDNIREQLSFVDGFEDNKDHGTSLIGS